MDYKSLSREELQQILDDPQRADLSQRVKIKDELARRNREEQAELARREREDQKDRRWPRADKIGIAIFIVAVLTFFATLDWFHSDKPTAVSKPQGSSAEPTKPTEPAQQPTEPAITPSNPKPPVNPHDEQRRSLVAVGPSENGAKFTSLKGKTISSVRDPSLSGAWIGTLPGSQELVKFVFMEDGSIAFIGERDESAEQLLSKQLLEEHVRWTRHGSNIEMVFPSTEGWGPVVKGLGSKRKGAVIKGTLKGETIEGKQVTSDGMKGPWKATRRPNGPNVP